MAGLEGIVEGLVSWFLIDRRSVLLRFVPVHSRRSTSDNHKF